MCVANVESPSPLEFVPNKFFETSYRLLLGPTSQFWDDTHKRMKAPELELWLAIIARTVRNLVVGDGKPEAQKEDKEYLNSEDFEEHAVLIGLDPDWIRSRVTRWKKRGVEMTAKSKELAETIAESVRGMPAHDRVRKARRVLNRKRP